MKFWQLAMFEGTLRQIRITCKKLGLSLIQLRTWGWFSAVKRFLFIPQKWIKNILLRLYRISLPKWMVKDLKYQTKMRKSKNFSFFLSRFNGNVDNQINHAPIGSIFLKEFSCLFLRLSFWFPTAICTINKISNYLLKHDCKITRLIFKFGKLSL